MTPEQKAAQVNMITAGMLCELAAMQAENTAAITEGNKPPHDGNAFRELPNKHGCHWNAVCELFNDY